MTNVLDRLRAEQLAATLGQDIDQLRRRAGRRPMEVIFVDAVGPHVAHRKPVRVVSWGVIGTSSTDVLLEEAVRRFVESALHRFPRVTSTGTADDEGSSRATVVGALLSQVLRRWSISTTDENTDTPSVLETSHLVRGHSLLQSGPVGYVIGIEKAHSPEIAHPGLRNVEWLRDFLSISRDQAFAVAGVAPATFYAWQGNPTATVRPKTVAQLMRVTASLRLLERAVDRLRCRELLTSGSPSLIDDLTDGGERAEAALRSIIGFAEPAAAHVPIRRVITAEEMVAALEDLETSTETEPDTEPLGSAKRLGAEELSEVETSKDDA